MDRFAQALEFIKNPPPRMAVNTPINALIVFDGWMGDISSSVLFKALKDLKKGTVYSVHALNENDGHFSVVLNEVSGNWPLSLFSAYKG